MYKIDENQIDKEHEELFEIASKALDMAITSKNKGDVKSTIIQLCEYMKIHFKNEEKYMEQMEYPYINHHKKLHEDIILEMNSFIKTISTLPKEKIDRRLLEYMDIWLINHIVCEDKLIIKTLR